MSLELKTNKLQLLQDRAKMLKKARQFFYDRDVLELDCPILNYSPNIDDSIEPIKVSVCNLKEGFLHTSPELFMKKMLSAGVGDCFYVGHVFRDHEEGDLHNVEFTMVEWYRLKLTFQQLIEETIEFIKEFIPITKIKVINYREALLARTEIDCSSVTLNELRQYVKKNLPVKVDFEKETFTDLMVLIFSHQVEPYFKNEELVVLKGYPQDQAAFAKVEKINGVESARRFEIYYRGIELTNGYDELSGGCELMERLENLNIKRRQNGLEELPLDEQFIAANANLPQCTGVSVGFDRLMMLRHNQANIHNSMALAEHH